MPAMMPPQMPPQPPQGMFSQLSAQGQGMPQGSPPPAPPQGAPPAPGAGGFPPQQGQPPQQPPQGQQGPQMPQITPQMLQMLMAQIQKQAPVSLAQQGRGGDSLIAHVAPGEMMIPPQVQTPKVLATLDKAFKQQHVSPQQFTAGSPASSVNPKTGVPEYNFLSAFLPAALGIAGSLAFPELAPALFGSGALSGAAAGAIGGGLGTTAGGLLSGQDPKQAIFSGLGSGVGGYALGSLGGAASGAANASKDAAMDSIMSDPGAVGMTADQINPQLVNSVAGNSAASPLAKPIFGSQMLGNAVHNFNPLAAAGSAAGGMVGSSLGAPAPKVDKNANLPSGFNNPMTPLSQLGSARTMLGMNNSAQQRPTFQGFNPMTNNPAAYNFFPTGQ